MDFGGLRALDQLDLDVEAGEIVALIGPNGAGKTTFFNCITGIYPPTEGDMLIAPPGKETQERVNGLKPNHLTERGLARTFQNIRLFPNMTVLENVMIGRHCRNEFAMNLTYGAQRRLDIARAMATAPFLLLLDEPAAGMNPQETKELDDLIIWIRDNEKISILLIEHDMKLVMSLSDRIFVVDYGRKIAQGTPEEIKNNPAVIKAYLGEEIDA